MKKRKKMKPVTAWTPGWAVVSATGIVRQISPHRDALRCIWQVGESVVEGRIVFIEAPKRRRSKKP